MVTAFRDGRTSNSKVLPGEPWTACSKKVTSSILACWVQTQEGGPQTLAQL